MKELCMGTNHVITVVVWTAEIGNVLELLPWQLFVAI